LVETKNVAKGILVVDVMLKSANVDLVMAKPLCPGRYLIMVAGDVGAVQNAVRSGTNAVKLEALVDQSVLPNIHPGVFEALAGRRDIPRAKALGVIESRSVVSAIVAADVAAKAAAVDLLKIRLAQSIGGKAVVTLTGEVSAVTAAVRAGSNSIQDSGFLVDNLVISAPHEGLQKAIY
jgi:microcompartment protein CcmL/EutN